MCNEERVCFLFLNRIFVSVEKRQTDLPILNCTLEVYLSLFIHKNVHADYSVRHYSGDKDRACNLLMFSSQCHRWKIKLNRIKAIQTRVGVL